MLPTDPFPRVITVFVNWSCNLTCTECWLYGENSADSTWLPDVRRQTIDLELVRRLCAEARERGMAPAVSLMGGEPLMHPQIAQIVATIKSTHPGVYLDMSTNATLLHRHAEAIATAGIDIVYVSLDGPDAATNDPIRGAGVFDRAMRGLRAAVAARERHGNPRVGVNLTVTPENYRTLPALVELSIANRLDTISINFVMFFGAAVGDPSRARFERLTGRPFLSWRGYLNPDQVRGVDPRVFEESITAAERIAAADGIELLIAPTRYPAVDKSRYFTPAWPRLVKERSCPKLYTQTTVLPNGDVLSCTPFSDTVMGNLGETGRLTDIWLGERYQRFRADFAGNLAPICMRCCDLNNDMDQDYDTYAAARLVPGGQP